MNLSVRKEADAGKAVMSRAGTRLFSFVAAALMCMVAFVVFRFPLGSSHAGRPVPFTPLTLPPMTKNEQPAEFSEPYPGAPIVESIKPSFGPRHGWTRVEVRGKNFNKGLKLLIGGREAIGVEVVSSARIRARIPENTFIGSADVTVRNPDGKAGALLNGFLYEGAIFEVPGYNVPPDWNWVSWLRLADMNKDGKRDFLIAAPWTPVDEKEFGNLIIYLQGPDRDGDGVPNFDPVRHNPVLSDTRSRYSSLDVGDLDNDGDLDFVAVGYVPYVMGAREKQINRVFLNDGACNFQVKDLPGYHASKAVEIGDVNRDGAPDIVVSNSPGQTQLFFGDGKGNFREVTQANMPKATLWTSHAHLVDVDGDGDLDMVLANLSNRKNKGHPNLLYLNDGKGRFQDRTAEWDFPSGNQKTYRVASADFDRDGDQDLVFANLGRNQLLVNDGTGHFRVRLLPPYMLKGRYGGPPADVSRGRNFYVLFSDINVDGYPDLVFCSIKASVMFYLNVPAEGGGRTFQPRTDLIEPMPIGHGAEMVELADVNGDGKPDLTIASGNEQTPLWINEWPEGFRFATCNVKYNLPYTDWVTWSCTVGDLNGDGRPDIAMGQHFGKEMILFLQGEKGWYRKDVPAPAVLKPGKTVVEDVCAVDVDGDGDQDLVLGLRQEPPALFLNDGKAGFRPARGDRALPATPIGTSEVLPVDVDLDGDMDLVMCNWQRGVFLGKGQKNSLFINEGGGTFRDRTKERLPQQGCTARGGAVGDVNRDGYPDIVFACQKATLLGGPMPNRLYLNRGREAPGHFVDASHLLPSNNSRSTDAVLLDVDRDGRLDIVFSNEVHLLKGTGGEDHLYHQRPEGGFEDWSDRLGRINRMTLDVRALDFNHDRAEDLFLLRSYCKYSAGYGPKPEYGRLMLAANDGRGNFSFPRVRQFDYIDQELHCWYGCCVYDLNGDGYPEIVEAVDGQVRIHQTFLRTKAVAHPVYAEVRAGEPVSFDASSTHLPWGVRLESATWAFGDGTKASGMRVSHRYRKPGTYRVTLRVKDTSNRMDGDTVTVLVK